MPALLYPSSAMHACCCDHQKWMNCYRQKLCTTSSCNRRPRLRFWPRMMSWQCCDGTCTLSELRPSSFRPQHLSHLQLSPLLLKTQQLRPSPRRLPPGLQSQAGLSRQTVHWALGNLACLLLACLPPPSPQGAPQEVPSKTPKLSIVNCPSCMHSSSPAHICGVSLKKPLTMGEVHLAP